MKNTVDRDVLMKLIQKLRPEDSVRRVAESLISSESPSSLEEMPDALGIPTIMISPVANSPRTILAVWCLGQLVLSKEQTQLATAYLSDVLLDRTPISARSKAGQWLLNTLLVLTAVSVAAISAGIDWGHGGGFRPIEGYYRF